MARHPDICDASAGAIGSVLTDRSVRVRCECDLRTPRSSSEWAGAGSVFGVGACKGPWGDGPQRTATTHSHRSACPWATAHDLGTDGRRGPCSPPGSPRQAALSSVRRADTPRVARAPRCACGARHSLSRHTPRNNHARALLDLEISINRNLKASLAAGPQRATTESE